MKLHLKYALVGSAVAGSLYFASCLVSFGTKSSAYYTYADFGAQLIFFVGLFWSIKQLRDVVLQGALDIKSGMLCGLQYTVMYSAIFGLLVIAQFLIPGFTDFLADLSREAFKKQGGIGPEEIEKRVADMLAQYTAFKVFTITVFRNMITGVVFSLVISMLLRKSRDVGQE